jgi:putative redox protein
MSIETKSTFSQQGVSLTWEGDLRFNAELPSGHPMKFDGLADLSSAVSPLEALLAATAACSAMDVVAILAKKQQKVASYRVEVEWERDTTGSWPHPVTAMKITHVLSGDHLDREAVRRSVELSDTKYCTLIATLRGAPKITSEFQIG